MHLEFGNADKFIDLSVSQPNLKKMYCVRFVEKQRMITGYIEVIMVLNYLGKREILQYQSLVRPDATLIFTAQKRILIIELDGDDYPIDWIEDFKKFKSNADSAGIDIILAFLQAHLLS